MFQDISSVLILGYGREGKSTHRYLQKHFPNLQIGIADRTEPKEILGSFSNGFFGENHLKSVFAYDVIVKSPGITPNIQELEEAKQAGKVITSATNIFFSQCKGTTIGITGTKGKSTTSSLIFEILSRKYKDCWLVGNIGSPALDYLSEQNNDAIFVIELSSYQLDDAIYSPSIAVLLNIVPEHLDYHGSFEKYTSAKSNIFRHQSEENILVFNPSHKIIGEITSVALAQKVNFSLESFDNSKCYIKEENIYGRVNDKLEQIVIPIEEIPLLGSGNLENVLASTSVGMLMKVPPEEIRAAIKSFKPLKHRLEFVGEFKGIRFYDDSIATVPEAAINAIEAFDDAVETLIVGGRDRGLDFSAFGRYLTRKSIKNFILFPETGERIWQAVYNACQNSDSVSLRNFYVSSMEEAVELAYKFTSAGKVCLLSPASPRHSLFKTFSERGDSFKKYVSLLGTD